MTGADATRADIKQGLQERIDRERRAILVVNTRSRRGRETFAEAKRLLTERGVTLDDSVPVRDPARLHDIVAQCVARRPPLVIVGGGDGTISAVVDAFAFKDVAFGVLPLGTANSFARTLGLPLDLPGAVDVLVGGKVVDIDLGRINDDFFANAAAIGLPAFIARAVPHGWKKRFGRAGYLMIAAAVLTRFKPFRCALETDDGATHKFEHALELRVGNGRYKGGLLAMREASVESQDLVAHIVVGRSVWTLVKVWTKIALGLDPGGRDVARLRARRFRIATEPEMDISIDGEPVARTPAEASVARQALCIVVPRERADLT